MEEMLGDVLDVFTVTVVTYPAWCGWGWRWIVVTVGMTRITVSGRGTPIVTARRGYTDVAVVVAASEHHEGEDSDSYQAKEQDDHVERTFGVTHLVSFKNSGMDFLDFLRILHQVSL